MDDPQEIRLVLPITSTESEASEHAAQIAHAGLPPASKSMPSNLALHVLRAVWPLSSMLSGLEHVNLATGARFDCLSYITDDPEFEPCCTRVGSTHFAIMCTPFLNKLVKIAHLLEASLLHRPRADGSPTPPASSRPRPHASLELTQLLDGRASASDAEVHAIVEHWPRPTSFHLQTDLSGFTVFYDLIRLVWMHEWAHALCGHLGFAEQNFKLARLHEFSTERCADDLPPDSLSAPRHEIYQGLEMHADEFAIRVCVQEVLTGTDPIGSLAGPRIDLVDRLLMLNVASSVFAIMWALAEFAAAPSDTFRAPPGSPDRFRITRSTHPPPDLRYLRFRDFQREITMKYGLANNAVHFHGSVDACSFEMIDILIDQCGYFNHLRGITPVIAKTPDMKALIDYESHLLAVSQSFLSRLSGYSYLPKKLLDAQH